MSYLYPDVKIIVFTKPPIAGKCKSRLIPHLGKEGAADVQKKLLFNITNKLKEYNICPFEIWTSEASEFFSKHSLFSEIIIKLQNGSDLGQRMSHAIHSSIGSNKPVILIGSDCAEFSKPYFTQAIQQLENHDVVFGPAYDGGYVLVGMSVYSPIIFQDIQWGENDVLKLSCQRLDHELTSYSLLPVLHDIDDYDDIKYM